MPFHASPVQIASIAILGGSFCVILLILWPRLRARRRGALADHLLGIENAPIPMWKTDAAGRLLWSNHACRSLWQGTDPPSGAGRLACAIDGATRHFDISQSDGLFLALPIDALIRAEGDLRDMVQAMAKTFAHLPTGLAVFDRQRTLQSFNPALADLTGLPPEFLSRRPSLSALLDRMRDQNMIPEPPNWKDWRRHIAAMERAAAHGHFEDVWSLPGGQTYRITGRPHPDGGLALMIDDISSEILRSRRYRADLELCQAVVDTMEDGIVVFASTGHLVMSNAAYSLLWDHNPGTSLAITGIRQLAEHWRHGCAPTTLWAEAEDYMTTLDHRDPWQAEARMLDGRLIECRFFPLAAGATLIRFRDATRGAAPLAIAKAGA